MTKQYFEAVAELIRDMRQDPACDRATIGMVAAEFVRLFKQSNPRFDTARFLIACGIRS